MMSTELLGAALEYLGRGWAPIPIRSRGDVGSRKRPLIPWECYQVRRPTEVEVRDWWRRWPDANVGLVMGAVAGMFALDLDGDADALLQAHGITLPDTPTSKTGGGGRHVLFAHPGEPVPNAVRLLVAPASNGGKAPQVDVRGDGGYIVAPPSIHGSGHPYEWIMPPTVPLAPAPPALLELIRQQGLPSHGTPGLPHDPFWVTEALRGPIPEGQRNDTAARLAGYFLAKDGNRVEVVLALLEPWALTVCQPPMDLRELQATVESIAERERGKGEAAAKDGQTDEGNGRTGPSQAQTLISLTAPAELFHTPDGEVYATIPVGSHHETWPVRAKGFRRWLVHRFYEAEGKPPGAQPLTDALALLGAKAQFDGPEHPVFVRVAAAPGTISLDLGDAAWAAAEVTSAGWRVIPDPPVRFRRARGMQPLPHPVAQGKVDELRPILNIADEDTWRLLVAWLVAALRPKGPYPILISQGEQGSGKSMLSRALRNLVDPSTASLRTTPREERDLMIAANNGWVLAFDNLSGMRPWLSDALCRLATGGGLSTRELYTDAEEVLFDAMRPVVLNGIDDLATRPDLADRALILTLPPIPERDRRPEAELLRAFDAARPRILGGLLDAVSAALREADRVALPALPRMADFAVWAAAAEPALGWPAGAFLAAYTGNRREAVDVTLEASPVAQAIRTLAERGPWTGTATEMLEALNSIVATEPVPRPKDWPTAPRGLSNALRRLAPSFRAVGIAVTFMEREKGRRPILVEKVPIVSSPSSPASPPSEMPRNAEGYGGSPGGAGGDGSGGGAGVAVSASSSQSPRQGCAGVGGDAGDAGMPEYSGRIPSDSDWGEV